MEKLTVHYLGVLFEVTGEIRSDSEDCWFEAETVRFAGASEPSEELMKLLSEGYSAEVLSLQIKAEREHWLVRRETMLEELEAICLEKLSPR